jgi:hypothetical protein
MSEPVSCGIASVNRTLCVLAAVWGLVPMAVMATGAQVDAGADTPRAQAPAGDSPEPREPCQLGEARGRTDALCLATTSAGGDPVR